MNDAHAPAFRVNPAEKGLVVFIHGFMGSPRYFDGFSEAMYQQGYSVASLLLPGHGSFAEEFAFSTMEQWQNHVNDEVVRFSRDHGKIWLVGHSMGGLLALNAAIKSGAGRLRDAGEASSDRQSSSDEQPRDDPQSREAGVNPAAGRVRGVMMIASPFKLALFSAKATINRLKMIFYRRNHPVKAAYIAGNSVRFSFFYWLASGAYHRFLPRFRLVGITRPLIELEKLIQATKKTLPLTRVPVTAVYSLSDELVSVRSLETLKSGINGAPVGELIICNSLHAYIPDNERAVVQRTMIKFISEN